MLTAALKEWKIVCDLLLEGRFALLLRKGGIAEWSGPGEFRLEYPQFVLYPSWAHQRAAMIKPAYVQRMELTDEPAEVTFAGWAEAARVWQVTSREAFDRLDDVYPWSKAQVDMRFEYKPDRPLWLVAVRAYALGSAGAGAMVSNDVEYRGCRSWAELRPGDEVDEAGSTPAMAAASLDALMSRVDETLG